MNNRLRKVNSGATPKPARAFGGPGTVGVEFDTAVNGLVIAQNNPPTDAQRVVLPGTFTTGVEVPGASAATAANYGIFWVAPYPCEIVSVRERHGTAGTDGGAVTLMLKKVPSGTAVGSGTDCLSAGINLKGTAATNASGSLHATQANYQLAAGNALGLVTTGTLTSLADVAVTVELKRLPS